MKRFLMTIALTCVLSVTAFAGLIPSDGVTAPPPDETTPTTSATEPGPIPTVGLTQQMSEAALNLIQLVLSAAV
jgi:hypothetical protein